MFGLDKLIHWSAVLTADPVDLQGVTQLSPSILFLRGFILEHSIQCIYITPMQIRQKRD